MIRGGLCKQAKLDFLKGVHQPGDTYKIALYTGYADVSTETATYSADGEVTGVGYSAGGVTLKGYTAGLQGNVAFIDWDDPRWDLATITARGALIYNASKGNKAITVLDFGEDFTSKNGLFLVSLPAPGATACVALGAR